MADTNCGLAVDAAGRDIAIDGKPVLKGLDFVVYQTDRELREAGTISL